MSVEPTTTRNWRTKPGFNPPDINFALGFVNKLEQVTKKHKITIKDISNKTKIPIDAIHAYFNGEKIATINQLVELSVAIGSCVTNHCSSDCMDITPINEQTPIGDQIWDYIASGHSVLDAVSKFGLKEYIVRDYIKIEKHKRGVPSPKAAQIAKLQALRETTVKPDVIAGMTATELAIKHNLTISVAYTCIRKYKQ